MFFKSFLGYVLKGWYYGCNLFQFCVLVLQVYEEMGEEFMWCFDIYVDDVFYWFDFFYEKDCIDFKGLFMVLYLYDCNDFKFYVFGFGFIEFLGFYNYLKNVFDVLYEEGEEGMFKMMIIGFYCCM